MPDKQSVAHSTPRELTELLKKPYARILIPEDDGTYTAGILEFPGCYAEGDTAAEAIENLDDAAAAWIAAAIEQGQDIPQPMTTRGYSGRINLRLPKSIHKQAARFAERDEVSLNQFFATAIAARVGAEEFYEHMVQRLQALPVFTVSVLMKVETSWNNIFGFLSESAAPPRKYERTEGIVEVPALVLDETKVARNG